MKGISTHNVSLTAALAAAAFASSGSVAAYVYDPATQHCYDTFYYAAPLTWDAARFEASLQGHPEAPFDPGQRGHLATITSAAEEQFIEDHFPAAVANGYWLGGFQAPATTEAAANWQWVTGESWNYTHWLPGGEPNDFNGVDENYLQFHPVTQDGFWNDASGESIGLVIEWEPFRRSVPDHGEFTPAIGAAFLAGTRWLLHRSAPRA